MWVLCVFVWALFSTASVAEDHYCPTAPPTPADRRADPSKLRVVQFNAEWLFIDEYDNCPGSNCPWKNETMAAHHLAAIASAISELNPDIINLCEVEGCDELNGLLRTPFLHDQNYLPYLLKGTDTSTGQNVGLLTRIDPVVSLNRSNEYVAYPVPSSQCPTGTGTYGCSKHYHTYFMINDIPVAMVGAHLLAFPDDTSRCPQREAQATVLLHIVEDYMNRGYEVIVLGDFNDFDGSVADVNNDQPISQVLNILKRVNSTTPLTSAASFAPQSERYTCWYDANNNCIYDGVTETSMIDHVLMSQRLANMVTNMFFAHYLYNESCDTFYSDHWAVVVDLDLNLA